MADGSINPVLEQLRADVADAKQLAVDRLTELEELQNEDNLVRKHVLHAALIHLDSLFFAGDARTRVAALSNQA